MVIHVCDKVPDKNKPYLIPMSMKFCPFCGEETMSLDPEPYEVSKARIEHGDSSWEGFKKVTPEQENHLAEIKNSFETLVDIKYRKGQEEHGGDLFKKGILDLVEDALNEAIDQFVYLITIRNKILDDRNAAGIR